MPKINTRLHAAVRLAERMQIQDLTGFYLGAACANGDEQNEFHAWFENYMAELDMQDISVYDQLICDMEVILPVIQELQKQELSGKRAEAMETILQLESEPMPLYLVPEQKKQAYIQILDHAIEAYMMRGERMIVYRKAKETDAKQIVDFYNYVGGETTFLSFEKDEYPLTVDAQIQSIRALENNQTNIMLLALDGEEIAGIATINSTHKIKGRHTGEFGIVIAKKYQGKGIGTELMNQLIDWAKNNGITKKISLITRADNIKAVSLYMKFGFVVEGCIKNQALIDGVYYDAYMMGLFLE